MKNIKKLILLLVACTMLLLLGCNKESNTEENVKNEIQEVKVGTWKTAQTIIPYFYSDFVSENYDVEVLPFTNPGDQKTALLSGSLDMCGTSVVTAISAASKGEPIKIIAGLCNKCIAFVVAKDSGIENVEDLVGKKIAYVPNTINHMLLLDLLKKYDIDPEKDVELVHLDFFDMEQALMDGVVDAFCSGEPYPSQCVANGNGEILCYPYFENGIGSINGAMITSEDMIENNPELIQELVNAHVDATNYLNDNNDAWMEKAKEFGTEEGVFKVGLENMELFADIDDTYIENMRNLAEYMLEMGLIDQVPDIESMFDLTFLENAKERE